MIARRWLPPAFRSDLAHRLVGATIGSAGIWAAGTLATFAIGVLLARPLGPEGYGVYGTALAIVSLLGVPATLGVPLLATRELAAAQARGDAAALAGHRRWFPRLVVATAIGTAALLLVGLALLGGVIAPHVRATLAWSALLVPGLAACTLGSAMLRGLGEVVAGQALDVLARPVLFLAGLGVVTLTVPLTPEGAVVTQAAASMLAAAAGFWWLGRRWSDDVRRAVPAHQLRLWSASAWPLAVTEGFRVLEGSYGVLLVSALATTYEAGLLRVALASLALCVAPISLQNLIVAPYLAEAFARGRFDQVQRIAAGAALFMTATVGAVTLAFVVAGPWLLRVAFGEAFEPAYGPMVLLCLAQWLTAWAGPSTTLLAMVGEERSVAAAMALVTAVGVLVTAPLALGHGAMGAAIGYLVANALRTVLLNRRIHRRLGIRASVLGWRRA